jgi:hypothetical protein
MGKKPRKKTNVEATAATGFTATRQATIPETPGETRQRLALGLTNASSALGGLVDRSQAFAQEPLRTQIIDRQTDWMIRAIGNQSPRTRRHLTESLTGHDPESLRSSIRTTLTLGYDLLVQGAGNPIGSARRMFETWLQLSESDRSTQ